MPRAKVVSESDSEGEKPTRTTRRTRQNRKSSASDGEKATSGSNINDTDTSVAKNKKKAKEKLKQDEPESGKLSSLDNNSTPPKKKKSAKNEEAEDGASSESESDIVEAKKEKKTAKKKSGKSKIASSESNDSDSDVSEVKNKKGKSKKSKKSADDEEASDDNDVKVVENGKKKANKRGKKTSSDDDDVIDLDESGGSESDVAPKKGKKNVKKRPKRKLISDSESEVSEGSASPVVISDSESSPEKPKRKRKRVRAVATSDSQSDGSGSDSKSPKKGRKNIKKLKRLSETTKAVNQAEAERIKRISERQKIYNSVFNASCFGEKKTLDSLVLDFDPKSKKALVAVEDALVKKLKPHQGKGIKFMWDSCFESLDVAKKQEGSGCILAHCMGLGKTLQVIALTYTLLTQASEHVKSVLVLCPLSTVLNWYSEFEKWLEGVDQSIEVYHLTDIKTNPLRADICMQWHKNGGVMILSYNNFRILTGSPRGGKKMKEKLLTSILDPGPDLIVCDEGHLLKNEQSAISKAVSKMRTMRRIVLTGTPLQNNLQEYHCMVQFVKPNLLGEKREFLNRFVNPIMNGQYGDSTAHDVKVMKQRSHVLHKKLEGIVQRADYTVLKPYLPEKYEYVISLRLSDLQLKLYQHYLENVSRNMMEDKKMGGSCLFQDFNNLRLVWTHPYLLKLKALEDDKKEEMKEFDESDDSIKDFVTDGSDTASSTSSDEGSGSMSGSDEEYKPSSTRRVTRGRVVDEQQVDRHFSSSDLRELYMLPDNKEEALTPIVPKDRLMAELLKEHKNTIFKIHEHDSLLENTEEEDLDEEERKAAWEAYENEKNYNANTARMNLNMGMPGMGMGMPMPGMGMGMPGMQPGMYQQRFQSTEGLPGPRNNYGIHPGMVGLNMAPGSRPANANAFPKMFTPSLLQQFYMQNPKVISNLYQKLKADNPLKPESQINGMLQQCVMGYLNAAMAQSQHSMNQGMPSAPPTAAPAAAPSGPIPMPPPSGPIPMPPPGGAIPMPAPGGAPSTAK